MVDCVFQGGKFEVQRRLSADYILYWWLLGTALIARFGVLMPRLAQSWQGVCSTPSVDYTRYHCHIYANAFSACVLHYARVYASELSRPLSCKSTPMHTRLCRLKAHGSGQGLAVRHSLDAGMTLILNIQYPALLAASC